MRPTPPIPVQAALLLVLLAASLFVAAPGAQAEEAAPPPKQKAQSATDARLAGEIGRALLSSKEAVRRRAVARLLKRIAAGGDLAAFLDAMSRATQAWADRHERLMEAWLHDAVHGNAAERERAVRLLTALGETAIRRLAIELRHARLHGGARRDASEPDVQAEGAPQTTADEPAPGTPRVYDLRDLVQRGMNPVQLRGLLQKAADAVEVKQFKTLFVVTALDRGHQQLLDRLGALRARYDQKPVAPQAAGAVDAPETAAGDTPERDLAKARTTETARRTGKAAAPPPPAGDAPPLDAPQVEEPRPQGRAAGAPAAPPAAGAKAKAAAEAWLLQPSLFHLPRMSLAAIVSARTRPQGRSQPQRVLPRALLAGTREVVRTEDFARAQDWLRALRRIPDARTGLPLRGATQLRSGGRTHLFAGKQIHYSKDVRRTKGGAWTIVTGTVPHGIAIDIVLKADATALRVDLVATRTDVGLPIPVVRVQPSEQAAPVELERPEWSTTRVHRSFDLPLPGGAALVSLKGLGSTPDDHLVLALTLRRPAPSK